jgi:hypothetical protein
MKPMRLGITALIELIHATRFHVGATGAKIMPKAVVQRRADDQTSLRLSFRDDGPGKA